MMLSINHLQVAVGKRVLLADVHEKWPFGSLVAVLGPNGVGKSTLLNHITGITLNQRGQVFLGDDDVVTLSALQRARRIASVAQLDEAPLETLVADRISHGLYARRASSPLSTREETHLIQQAARATSVIDLLERPLLSLSGGQRKKAHIARALVDTQAEVYILDEPDAGLDSLSREHMMQLLKSITQTGKLVVVSLHHRELADTYADHVIELSKYLHPPL